MRTLGVIPARMESIRLPRKPLLPIGPRPLIEWVYRGATSCPELDEVVVATDDEEIAECVRKFGGSAQMTDPRHQSGTDRVAEVALGREDVDVIVNIQGDQPFLPPEAISALLPPLLDSEGPGISTVAVPFSGGMDPHDPSTVKVVVDARRLALYFSRSVIPYAIGSEAPPLKHIGLYGFQRSALITFRSLQPSPLEKQERLEQLRALENGLDIFVAMVERDCIEVNTQADYEKAQTAAGEWS